VIDDRVFETQVYVNAMLVQLTVRTTVANEQTIEKTKKIDS